MSGAVRVEGGGVLVLEECGVVVIAIRVDERRRLRLRGDASGRHDRPVERWTLRRDDVQVDVVQIGKSA